ncbi:hypothetical protein TUM20985_14400 [Mycobacterium antarcticum]|uniref:hypothetical protein n=1 Tax=Mycolicibacterium sp. TUM20985 TaxID=3023370 RepID=UPI0025741E98|nr:hypothetical protein [Mycolicibacterium sp. TUM20985]BDX30893.1 hypothetical protein TUM20985_14400 [Mycolicibacterium sp. TUM20985]
MTTWGVRKTVGAVAVAAAVAGVGGAAIAAATGSGSHAMGEFGFPGMGGPPPLSAPFTGAHHDLGGAGSVHGESVVADGRGGFTTRITQTGVITAISATSVTARSDDGFTQTYVIREVGTAVKPPFAVHDPIVIDALREGGTATVSTMRPPLSAGH